MKKQRKTKNILLAALLLCMAGTLVLWAADDAKIKLTDAAGTSTFAVQDSSATTVMSVNSNGVISSGVASSKTGTLKLYNATNANTTTLQSGVATAAVTYTLPTADAATSGSALTSNGAGTLSWTSPLPIANGGTANTTANAAFNALAPAQAGNAGKFLQTDATNTAWASALPQNVQYYTDTTSDTLVAGAADLWDGAAASITPVAATNRVLVQGVIQVSSNAATASVQTFTVRRNAGCAGTQVGFNLLNYTAAVNTEERVVTFTFVDAPATVAAQTYTICGSRSAGTIVTPSIALTLMEIGP